MTVEWDDLYFSREERADSGYADYDGDISDDEVEKINYHWEEIEADEQMREELEEERWRMYRRTSVAHGLADMWALNQRNIYNGLSGRDFNPEEVTGSSTPVQILTDAIAVNHKPMEHPRGNFFVPMTAQGALALNRRVRSQQRRKKGWIAELKRGEKLGPCDSEASENDSAASGKLKFDHSVIGVDERIPVGFSRENISSSDFKNIPLQCMPMMAGLDNYNLRPVSVSTSMTQTDETGSLTSLELSNSHYSNEIMTSKSSSVSSGAVNAGDQPQQGVCSSETQPNTTNIPIPNPRTRSDLSTATEKTILATSIVTSIVAASCQSIGGDEKDWRDCKWTSDSELSTDYSSSVDEETKEKRRNRKRLRRRRKNKNCSLM